MFTALVFGDPHLSSSHIIGQRRDDYNKTCLEKLTFILRTAIQRKVNVVITPGDIYHDKEESKIARSLDYALYLFIDNLKAHNIDFLAVPGNHDMLFHNPDVSRRPLGLLAQAKSNFYLVNETLRFYSSQDGTNTFKVYISGSPYTFNGDMGDIQDREQYFPKRPESADYHIHITHGSQIPFAISNDFQFMDVTNTEDLVAQNPAWDLNINGHIHWVGEENLLLKFGKKYVLNPGSLTRGALKMENLTRGIYCYLVTIQNNNGDIYPTFERIEIPHRPAEEIFDVNAYLDSKKQDAKIAEFIEQLKECSLSEKSSNSNIEKLIAESSASDVVKKRAKEFLDKLS